jgi:general secretion pathway protein G
MKRRNRRGFTLVEMMVVIVILGILASVVTVKVYQHVRKARVTKAKIQIREFMKAIKIFKMETSKIPEELTELTEKTEENPDPQLDVIPKDPWGNDYDFYTDDDHEYVIVSYGADGQEGGEDEEGDIYSYDLEGEGAEGEGEEEAPE